jgi:hypothetical protein
MAKNNIEISVQEEMKNVGQAMRKVVSAALAGAPGVAATIKGKKKSAQFSFKIRSSNDRRSLVSIGRRQVISKIFTGRTVEVENAIRRATEAVVAGLVGVGNPNVRVFNRSLGSAKPQRKLEQEGFAKFIKSNAGAGEIGLPDPDGSLHRLKIALMAAISVDVVVRKSGPQIKFSFDQRKLIRMTPHPDRFEGGPQAPFFSWLSLVTGPDFLQGGTPGFSLVRVGDLKDSFRKSGTASNSRQASKINLRRANIVEGLIRSSRTRGNAGELAGIMMRNRAKRSGVRSPAEAFGGQTKEYRPSPRFNGFWDEYWLRMKLELGTWSRRVMSATVRALLKG